MKKIIYILAALLAMAACSKETDNGTLKGNAFAKGQEVTISASAGSNGQTRVVGTDDPTNNEIDFTWEEGDQIQVKMGEATATFTLTSGEGTASATFKGEMPAAGSSFDIQYPVTDPDLSTQTYAEGGKIPAGKIAFAATGCTLSSTNALKPANSVLQLNLYAASQAISKIVVTNMASEATYTLNINPAVTLGTTAETPTPFYIVMPNGEYKISAEIFDNAETPASICSFTTSSEKEFGGSNGGGCVNMAAKEVAIPGEAKIGTTVYKTLADAITAANATSDATIELLKDVTVSESNSISKSMTLDMKSKSISISSTFNVVEGKVLTIKDGSFSGCFSLTGSGTASITNGNVTSDGNALSCTGGTITIYSGKFKGSLSATSPGKIELMGGIYSAEPTIDCMASGYALELNDDATTKATYPYKVIVGGGPLGGGLGDIDKTDGSW